MKSLTPMSVLSAAQASLDDIRAYFLKALWKTWHEAVSRDLIIQVIWPLRPCSEVANSLVVA